MQWSVLSVEIAPSQYQPTTLKRRLKAPSSSFGLPLSRSKARTDDDLSLIQTDMVKLEAQYGDTGRAIDKDGRSRKRASQPLKNKVPFRLTVFGTAQSFQVAC